MIQISFFDMNDSSLGFVVCSESILSEPLAKLRALAEEEIPELLPSKFKFTVKKVPISEQQEKKYQCKNFLTKTGVESVFGNLDVYVIKIKAFMAISMVLESTPALEKKKKNFVASKESIEESPPPKKTVDASWEESSDGMKESTAEIDMGYDTTIQDDFEEISVANEVEVEVEEERIGEDEDVQDVIEIRKDRKQKGFFNFPLKDSDLSTKAKKPTAKVVQIKLVQRSIFGSKSEDDPYRHVRSKGLKLYTTDEIQKAKGFSKHRMAFWNKKAEEISSHPSSRHWKKEQVHGAIDVHWTLSKTDLLKQEVKSLENRQELLNDMVEGGVENILQKTNILKNQDRLTAAAISVDTCDEELDEIKNRMNATFNSAEREIARKKKVSLEEKQKMNWNELKKAQDAMRKCLEQARKKIVDLEVDLAERNLATAEEPCPPIGEAEELQLAAELKCLH